MIFLHQDIIFEKENSLENFIKAISKVQEAIVGLYGASHGKHRKITEILYEEETLDECCIAMPKNVWQTIQFNEEIVDADIARQMEH